jgi:hypothetical protein
MERDPAGYSKELSSVRDKCRSALLRGYQINKVPDDILEGFNCFDACIENALKILEGLNTGSSHGMGFAMTLLARDLSCPMCKHGLELEFEASKGFYLKEPISGGGDDDDREGGSKSVDPEGVRFTNTRWPR